MGAHTFTTNAQQEWDTKTKELYAVWRFVKDWQHILRGRPFIIHTDHANLTNYGADPTSVQRRQLRFIDEFDYEPHWIPGEKNTVPDSLSRIFVSAVNIVTDSAPATTQSETPDNSGNDTDSGINTEPDASEPNWNLALEQGHKGHNGIN